MIKYKYLDSTEFIDFWHRYYNLHKEEVYELYIHFPWCRSICKYCSFSCNTINKISDSFLKYYYEKMLDILKMMKDKLIDNDKMIFDSLFFGGGTASLWPEEMLKGLNEYLKDFPIKERVFEMHPLDLSYDKLDLYIDEMKMDIICIGIQSFNKESNDNQNRYTISPDELKKYVDYIKSKGVFVKVDMICMYNGDTDKEWDIFVNDLYIMKNYVNPSGIDIYPQYKSSKFFENAKRLREYLQDKNKYDMYIIDENSLSLDYDKIISYGDRPYTLYQNDYYVDQLTKSANLINGFNCIGLGGILNHVSNSYSNNKLFSIDSMFVPEEYEYIFYLSDNNIPLLNQYQNKKNNKYNKRIYTGNNTQIISFEEEFKDDKK